MTQQEETTYIHHILNYMLQPNQQHQEYHSFFLQRGVPKDDLLTLFRLMKEANLIQSAPNANSVINLNGHGRALGQHSGGYKGYLAAQRQAQEEQKAHEQEQRELERISAYSTQDAATSAKGSLHWAKVSGIAAVIAILASILFFWIQRADSNATDEKVKALEQRIQALEKCLNVQPQ